MRTHNLEFTQVLGGDTAQLTAFSENSIFGTEIYTSLCVCGAEPRIGSLWTASDSDGVKLLMYDNGAYLTCVSQRGGYVGKANGNNAIFAALPRKNRQRVMVYRGESTDGSDGAVRIKGTELMSIYKAIHTGEQIPDASEKRYVYRVLCDGKGFSDSFAIIENGETVATASVVAENKKYALIGDVYTVSSHRGRGYASRLVKTCVRCALDSGLIPVLYCEKELVPFYRKTGFCRVIL